MKSKAIQLLHYTVFIYLFSAAIQQSSPFRAHFSAFVISGRGQSLGTAYLTTESLLLTAVAAKVSAVQPGTARGV